jgi:FtsZ-interacting cell division protein ZipA
MIENVNHITLVISIVLAAVLVAGIYTTITQAAFAAKNLNSSKSNIYRQNANLNQEVVDGDGPTTQTNTNICNCPSDDDNTVDGNDNQDNQNSNIQ